MTVLRAFRASTSAAFSMIELMGVMAVITVLAGVSVPAMKGVNGGNSVEAGASKISGLLTLARNESIAQHTIFRFVVATDWAGKGGADSNLRKMSLWIWRSESASYEPLTKWEELPLGVIMEKTIPAYVLDSQYAREDKSTTRGSCVFDDGFAQTATFAAVTTTEPISGLFV